ncbi:hypothetical protein PVAP13_1NG381800 [Panicum virgatum]|uniref:Uncharacterized protein n=1 Tax=Panicum virgatum TaxID=38727 RepID=A0A8T0X017_PANVG|nr:hypothetical protein PVAP13_1NG381800 [Panicum virgatum]
MLTPPESTSDASSLVATAVAQAFAVLIAADASGGHANPTVRLRHPRPNRLPCRPPSSTAPHSCSAAPPPTSSSTTSPPGQVLPRSVTAQPSSHHISIARTSLVNESDVSLSIP